MKQLTSKQYDELFEALAREGLLDLDEQTISLTEKGCLNVANLVVDKFNNLPKIIANKRFRVVNGDGTKELGLYCEHILGNDPKNITKNSIRYLVQHYADLVGLH